MTPDRRWTLRALHRTSAIVLGCFLLLHVANHVVGLAGQAEHIAFMHAARPIYRNVVIEPLLLFFLIWQAGSGLVMVVRGWRSRRGAVAWLQAGSGLYLAAFATIHVLAVLSGRLMLHLDTDFRFAAAGFHVPGWPWFFGPYYSLAVFALFAHVGCAIYWTMLAGKPHAGVTALRTMLIAGAVLGLLIISALGGLLYPVEIPAPYKATYTGPSGSPLGSVTSSSN